MWTVFHTALVQSFVDLQFQILGVYAIVLSTSPVIRNGSGTINADVSIGLLMIFVPVDPLFALRETTVGQLVCISLLAATTAMTPRTGLVMEQRIREDPLVTTVRNVACRWKDTRAKRHIDLTVEAANCKKAVNKDATSFGLIFQVCVLDGLAVSGDVV